MNSELSPLPKHILFFDGYCHFCHGSVQFVQRYDYQKRFFFAPLQGEAAKNVLNLKEGNIPESVVYYRKGKVYYKSTAGLLAAWDMHHIWSLLAILLIVPAPIRNLVYDWIARNRYKWFGKKEHCVIPSDKEKQQYLP